MTFKNNKLMTKEVNELCGYYEIKDKIDLPLLLIQKNFLIFCQKKKKPSRDEARLYMTIERHVFDEQFEEIYDFYEKLA